MRRTPDTSSDALVRGGLASAGAALLASAALSGKLAFEHMTLLGGVCGDAAQAAQAAHCGWCAAAVALGLAGFTSFAAALQPSLRAARRRV
ncbi:hypothetical protein [Phenylobacterium sp.]|jgi:hypothetical protein|uniref:hypothetical protein n=1 Tax=Phenylobacterium sp. TaxID=1871053 RepID=UPI002F95BBE7